jgi:hypothetical protein
MDESNFRLPPQQWQLLRRPLDEALDLPSTQRSSWLSALPAEHATLASRLKALLAHADAPAGRDQWTRCRKLERREDRALTGEALHQTGTPPRAVRQGDYSLLTCALSMFVAIICATATTVASLFALNPDFVASALACVICFAARATASVNLSSVADCLRSRLETM